MNEVSIAGGLSIGIGCAACVICCVCCLISSTFRTLYVRDAHQQRTNQNTNGGDLVDPAMWLRLGRRALSEDEQQDFDRGAGYASSPTRSPAQGRLSSAAASPTSPAIASSRGPDLESGGESGGDSGGDGAAGKYASAHAPEPAATASAAEAVDPELSVVVGDALEIIILEPLEWRNCWVGCQVLALGSDNTIDVRFFLFKCMTENL